MMAPTGRLSVPRVMRWIGLKDRAAAVERLDRLAELPGLARILVGHGDTLTDSPRQALKQAARDLL
jgi:hypothetical protein